jgi:hypothetical protein
MLVAVSVSCKVWHYFTQMKWQLSAQKVGGAAVLKVGCSIICTFTSWECCLGNSHYIIAWVSLLKEPGSEHWATVMHVHDVVIVMVYLKKEEPTLVQSGVLSVTASGPWVILLSFLDVSYRRCYYILVQIMNLDVFLPNIPCVLLIPLALEKNVLWYAAVWNLNRGSIIT